MAQVFTKNNKYKIINIKTSSKIINLHLTPVRMVIVEKSANNKCWRRCGEKETLRHCWWECKLVQPLWRTVRRFLKKLKIELPYDPAIPFLAIYADKTVIQKDTCTLVFTAALFTTAKTWKQPKCLLTDKWIKMWYTHTHTHTHNGILLSHEKNEIMSFAATRMDLEIKSVRKRKTNTI